MRRLSFNDWGEKEIRRIPVSGVHLIPDERPGLPGQEGAYQRGLARATRRADPELTGSRDKFGKFPEQFRTLKKGTRLRRGDLDR